MQRGDRSGQKGLERVGGRRIIDRVADALRGMTPDLVVAANDPSASEWLPGTPAVPDIHPGTGGLAGVEAALQYAAGADVVVVAWDMPFVTSGVLRLLLDAARAHAADVALPESDSPYGVEPFCAAYTARVRPALTDYLARGGGPASDFLRALPRLHRVPASAFAALGETHRIFFSVNTPEDLRRAQAMDEIAE